MIRETDSLSRQNRPLASSEDVQHGGMAPATAQRIENALRAMGAVMVDANIPRAVRDQVCLSHRKLHACRDELTVRRMEKSKGLAK